MISNQNTLSENHESTPRFTFDQLPELIQKLHYKPTEQVVRYGDIAKTTRGYAAYEAATNAYVSLMANHLDTIDANDHIYYYEHIQAMYLLLADLHYQTAHFSECLWALNKVREDIVHSGDETYLSQIESLFNEVDIAHDHLATVNTIAS